MSSQKGLPKGRKFDCQCATCRERRCLTTVTKIEAMKRRNPTASSTLDRVLAAEVSSLLLPAPERLVSDTKRSSPDDSTFGDGNVWCLTPNVQMQDGR